MNAERFSDMPASHRAEDPRIRGPDSPALPSPLAAAALGLQSQLCCSEAKCKDQRGERKARKGGAPGASRVPSKQIFKAGKRSHCNSSDLLTAQTGSDACGGEVATAAAGAGVSPSAWAPTLPSPPQAGRGRQGLASLALPASLRPSSWVG